MLRRCALAVLLIVACDGDRATTIHPPDAEAPADAGLSVESPDVDVYVADRAELSATPSRRIGVTYGWKVARVPNGSAINDASLGGATSPTPSFVPDVAGEYVLVLTVTAPDQTIRKDVHVRARSAPVIFTRTHPQETPPYLEVHAAAADGTADRTVGCKVQPPFDGGADASRSGCYCSGGGKACDGDYPTRPAWMDGRLAWVQEASPTSWRVVAAEDKAGATPEVVFTCGGKPPRQIAPLADGSLLTSYRESSSLPIDLVVPEADAQGQCVRLRNLTSYTSAGSRARDFAVSRTGEDVIFLSHEGTNPADNDNGMGGLLFRTKVDGTIAPVPVVGGQMKDSTTGPRFIAGGTQVTWTRSEPDASTSIVSVVALAGGPVRDIATGDGGTTVVVPSNGGCATAPGDPSLAPLGVLVLLVLRRRACDRSR